MPTWWPSTSAPSLSLTSRIRSAMSASGALSTAASSADPGGTTTRSGLPTTFIPACASPAANAWAAAREGSADRSNPSCSRPPSTISAVIGLTMSSGT